MREDNIEKCDKWSGGGGGGIIRFRRKAFNVMVKADGKLFRSGEERKL